MISNLASFCFLTSPLVAFAAGGGSPQTFSERLTAVERQVKTQTLYNASSRAEVVDGYNLFLTGDLLYWKGEENGLTYALKSDVPNGNLLSGKTDFKDPDFEWDIGFRIGLGYNIPHDNWDLYANWTHFNTGAHGSVNAERDDQLFPVWALPAGPLNTHAISRAKSFWKLSLNTLDVELGKEYYVGKSLSLRPHLDLRTAWIDQHFTVDYENPPNHFEDQVSMKNDYWGIGPRLGLNLQWWLSKSFSIEGGGAVSLVYGDFSIHQREEVKKAPDDGIHLRHHLHITRAMTDLGLFIAWDHMFFHNQFHLGVKLGWEQHIIFEQNQFFRFLDPYFQGSIVSNQGDLTLQGWTFAGRIDF